MAATIELHALSPIRTASGRALHEYSYVVRLSEIRSVLDAGEYRTITFLDGKEQDVSEPYATIAAALNV